MEWKNVPDVVATHFGVSGDANAYGDKKNLIIISVVAVITCVGLAIAECFPRIWNFPVKVTAKNRGRLVQDGFIMLGVLKILMAAMFAYIGFCMINGRGIGWPMYVLLGLVIIDTIGGTIKMIKDR